MNDKSLLLKTEMLRLTEQIKLYEHKTEDILQTKYFFQVKQCSNGTVCVERIKIRLFYQKIETISYVGRVF